MVEPESDILRPIATAKPHARALPKTDGFTRLTRILQILAVLLALVATGLSIWFFSGFVENDRGIWHLLSAFLFSFGIGALAFLPAIIIARLAGKTIENGPVSLYAWLAIALILPWVVLSIFLLRLGNHWIWASCGILTFCLFCLAWAVNVIRLSRHIAVE